MENEFISSFRDFLKEAGIGFSADRNFFFFPGYDFVIYLIEKDGRADIKRIYAQDCDTLYLYEDRWRNCGEIIRKRIMCRIGIFRSIFARKCKILRGTEWKDFYITGADFLNKYHSYGYAGSKYRYALAYGGEIVAVATFSAPRHMFRRLLDPFSNVPEKEVRDLNILRNVTPGQGSSSGRGYSYNDAAVFSSYEWVRYASLPDIRVTGGMGRLLKAFLGDIALKNSDNPNALPVEIMTYSDNEWSCGDVYKRLGFAPAGERSPVEYYVDKESYERLSLRKLSEMYNSLPGVEKIAARQIPPQSFMERFYRIANMGSRKFLLHI